MSLLSFLSQVTVEAVVIPAKAAPQTRAPRELQPKDGVADLRIWDNGAIYPSNALVAEFNLEYSAKDAADAGNGLDIIDTALMPVIKTPQRFIGASVTARKEGKLDVFRATTYKEDGSPVNSVTTQGTAMYGKETLLPLLKEVYNVVPNEEGYIDLLLIRDFAITSPNGVFQFPKTITRGERKGETTYIRRENQSILPISPAEGSVFVEPEETETEEAEEVTVEVPAINIPTGSKAIYPVTPDEALPAPQEETAEEEYDILKVGNLDVKVEKETNPLFLEKEEEAEEAPKSSDPFADEEEAEEVIITDADVIQEGLLSGAYDEEEEELAVPSDPFSDVPFERPTATEK